MQEVVVKREGLSEREARVVLVGSFLAFGCLLLSLLTVCISMTPFVPLVYGASGAPFALSLMLFANAAALLPVAVVLYRRKPWFVLQPTLWSITTRRPLP